MPIRVKIGTPAEAGPSLPWILAGVYPRAACSADRWASMTKRRASINNAEPPVQDAMHADVIVLGAGMVGVSVALHLQQRGRDVVLNDRRGAGEETSYGNSGLIQSEGVIPYTFPREFGVILSYAMNRRSDVVYHLSALPRIAPWMFHYWQNATPERIERSAQALAPLMAQCVGEHDALIAEAGDAARALVRHEGWIRCL